MRRVYGADSPQPVSTSGPFPEPHRGDCDTPALASAAFLLGVCYSLPEAMSIHLLFIFPSFGEHNEATLALQGGVRGSSAMVQSMDQLFAVRQGRMEQARCH